MTLLTNSAEGGTNGTTVTTGNSGGASGQAFSAVTLNSGTFIFSNAWAHGGSLSYLHQQIAANSLFYDMTADSANAAASWSARFYLRLNALPSATAQGPLNWRSAANSNMGNIQLTATGAVLITTGTGGAVSTSGNTLAINTDYRFEVYGTNYGTSSAATTCDIYLGDNTGTPYMTTNSTHTSALSTVGIFRLGKSSSGGGSIDYYIDDWAWNIGSATPIGPTVIPPAPWSWVYTQTFGS